MSESVKKIINLIQSDDLYSALLFSESQLKINPNSSELIILSMDLNRRLGRKNECKLRLNQLVANISKAPESYIKLSQKLYSMKQFDSALDILDLAKTTIQSNVDLDIFHYIVVAQNYYRLSDSPASELKKPGDYAEQLLKYYPNSWAGYACAAKELAVAGKYDKSKEILRNGLILFKNNLELLCTYSNICRLSGDRNKSVKINKKIIDFYPKTWHGYYRTSQDLVILQKPLLALEVIEKGLRSASNSYFLLSLGIDVAMSIKKSQVMKSYAITFLSKFSTGKQLSYQSYSKYIDTKLTREYVKSIDNDKPNNAEGSSNLFILTGCSGSGKTSLLRSTQLDTELLFLPQKNSRHICKMSDEIIEELNLVSQLYKKRSSVSESYERAMLFGSYFPLAQFYSLKNEPYLPKDVILHIDIRQLLFSRKIAHLYKIRHFDFNYQNLSRHGYWRLMEFFSHQVFRQFQQISISTIEPSYDRNLKRFQGREGTKFFLGNKNPREMYNKMYSEWFNFISSLPTKADNIIIEERDGYSVYDRSEHDFESINLYN